MIKRSVVIAGRHYTSISLEQDFMTELERIAELKRQTINQ